MRIVLDLQSLQTKAQHRGIGRYSLALARAMIAEGRQHEFLIALNHAFPEAMDTVKQIFADLLPPDNIFLFQVPAPIVWLDPNHWRSQAAELVREHFLEQLQPDWVYVSSLFEGLRDDAVTSVNLFAQLSTAVTLYDLIPYRYPEHYLTNEVVTSWYMRKASHLRNCEILLAISEYTRQEAIELLGVATERVINIATDADACFRKLELSPDTVRAIRERYGLSRDFVMYTGGIDWRKNIEGLMQAYALMPADIRASHQLVVCCAVPDYEQRRWKTLVSRLGLAEDEVVFTGYVSDDDLVALYNLCKLFVFPSMAEGFGLPVLEAMRCGAVVIGSNTTSIPEVIGLEAALFDPTSVNSMCQKLHQALTDDQFLQVLRQNGKLQAAKFSWNDSARRALEALEEFHERRQSEQREGIMVSSSLPVKPRLAYISPLPPEKSVIADYSVELLPELTRYYHIDLVTDLKEITDSGLATNFHRLSVAEFEHCAHTYDRLLYHLEDSTFCGHMFSLLKRYPGTVVLHDFFLSGALHYLEVLDPKSEIFRKALYYSHGYPALRNWRHKGPEEAMLTYPCCLEVLQHAQGVIVHSEQALQLAERFFQLNTDGHIIKLPPLYQPPQQPDRMAPRQASGLTEQAQIARQYAEAIESFASSHPVAAQRRLLAAIVALPTKKAPSDRELARVAVAIAENMIPTGRRQLLVDISNLIRTKANPGMLGASDSLLKQLLAKTPAGYRLEPVYRSKGLYRYARRFMARFLDIGGFGLDDAPVDVASEDVFLGMDINAGLGDLEREWLRHHGRRGLKEYFIVSDVLPLFKPDYFSPQVSTSSTTWFEQVVAMADGLICTSQAVFNELMEWLKRHPVKRQQSLSIGYFHLGADSEPSINVSRISAKETAEQSAEQLKRVIFDSEWVTVWEPGDVFH